MTQYNNQIPKLVGILNVTPDSFYDGGCYLEIESLSMQIDKLVNAGSDIIDLGGESTRPGSLPISPEEELGRILPALQAIRRYSDIPISLDTRRAVVARKALDFGITIINDVSGLRYDPDMVGVLTDNPDLDIVIMHCKGEPTTMQINPHYDDVIGEILEFFRERISFCEEHGIASQRIIIDPGIGFGKDMNHNLQVLRHLSRFKEMGVRLMLGVSRKRFINNLISPSDRLPGTLATVVFAIRSGVDYLRVHDVGEHLQFISVFQAINGNG